MSARAAGVDRAVHFAKSAPPRAALPAQSPMPSALAADAITYVVLACRAHGAAPAAVRVLGTMRAPDRGAARRLATALAHSRGGPPAPALGWGLRVRAAGACRRGWLLEALERDGAALRAGGDDG